MTFLRRKRALAGRSRLIIRLASWGLTYDRHQEMECVVAQLLSQLQGQFIALVTWVQLGWKSPSPPSTVLPPDSPELPRGAAVRS